MYTNSNGEQIKVETLETTHLINALSKKYRDIFNATTYEEIIQMTHEIDTLKEEYYKRLNKFVEKLGE